MTSPEPDNLVRIGKLKREPPSDEEVVGLLQPAEDRPSDAGRADLSYSSRFERRNLAEYEGHLERDDQLLPPDDLVAFRQQGLR